MGKRTAAASPNPSHGATEEAHDHHHHHNLFQHRRNHQNAKPAPPAAAADSFACSSSDVNDCADAFIKQFRQQLELQRLQSIENYHQMLARSL